MPVVDERRTVEQGSAVSKLTDASQVECRPKRLRDRWTHHRPDSSRGQSGFMRIAFQDRASDSQDSVPVVGGRSEARMSGLPLQAP